MNSASLERSAICLVTDRLSAGFLGAYGNTWINTPCFDRLAFDSLLFDQVVLNCLTLPGFYDSVWHGREPLSDKRRSSLPTLLADAGIETVLVTDEPEVANIADDFDRCIAVATSGETPVATDVEESCVEETGLGRFFATAAECIAAVEQPSLVWLHTRGMAAPWDAPYSLRAAYAGDEDPPPPAGAEVPCRKLAADHDPDELLGLSQAYAGQVSLWDACLGLLGEAIASSSIGDAAIFSVMSARGFPLGEHGHIGGGTRKDMDEDLYGELLHLPWLVRVPGGRFSAVRCDALLQPADMYDLLLQWWELSPPELADQSFFDAGLSGLACDRGRARRDYVLSHGSGGQWSIRTPAWFLRNIGGEQPHQALYVKPDDRWEVNDVSGRCGDVVAALSQVYENAVQGRAIGPLDEILLTGME